MTPDDIHRIRTKLNIDEEVFAQLFGLSSAATVVDMENGSVKPAGIIITMLTLLDSQPLDDAQLLMEQMLDAARKNSR